MDNRKFNACLIRKTLLTIVLTLQLIALPQVGFAEVCSYDAEYEYNYITLMNECNKSTVKEWVCASRSCIVKQAKKDSWYGTDNTGTSSTSTMGMFNESCAKAGANDADCLNGAAAMAKVSDDFCGMGNSDKQKCKNREWWSERVPELTAGMSLVGLISNNPVSGGAEAGKACTSGEIFKYTSLAALAAEVYTHSTLNSAAGNAVKQYSDALSDKSKSDTDRQVLAFQYLLAEMKSVKETLTTKSIIYSVETLGYLAALIAAIVEVATQTGQCPIVGSTTPEKNNFGEPPMMIAQKDYDNFETLLNGADLTHVLILGKEIESFQKKTSFSSPTINDYELKKEILGDQFQGDKVTNAMFAKAALLALMVPTVPAQSQTQSTWTVSTATGGFMGFQAEDLWRLLGVAAGASIGLVINQLSKNGSVGILSMSALLMVISAFLAGNTIADTVKVGEQVDLVQKALDDFQLFVANSQYRCLNGHESIKDVWCYCHKADGTVNKERAAVSDTCKKLIADKKSSYVDPFNYEKASPTTPKGCVRIDNKFDPNCTCRSIKDGNGVNACMKSPITNFGKPGVHSMNLDMLKQLQGNSGSVGLTGGTLADARSNLSKAIAGRGMANNMMNQNAESFKDIAGINKGVTGQFAQAFKSGEAQRILSRAGMGDSPKTGANVSNLQKQIEKIKKGDVKSVMDTAKKTSENTLPAASKTGPTFNTPMFKSESKVEDIEAMNQQYDIKQNDIVDNKDESIWRVISNRYSQSGLRRLFDDEATTTPAPVPENK